MRYYLLYILWFFLSTYCAAQNAGYTYTNVDLQNLNAFKPSGGNWKIAGDVFYDLNGKEKSKLTSGTGLLVNDASAGKSQLLTVMEHGDIQLELEFMMDKNSASGIFFQGRYEIELADSWGVRQPKVSDCGAIAERWDNTKPAGYQGYEGHVPAQNVVRAPGLWQRLIVIFRAPRFNGKGEKIQNARFVKVIHNGVTLHENVEVTGPTRNALFQDERSLGPLMIPGDQGSFAIRNIRYKAYGQDVVKLSDLKLEAYEGQFSSVAELSALKPTKEMNIDLLEHQGTDSKEHYGGRITGKIHIPKNARYLFVLNLKWIPTKADANPEKPNGAGQLKIADKTVITIDGKTGGSDSTILDLEAGVYPIELVYHKQFKIWFVPGDDIILGVEAPAIAYSNLNAVLRLVEAVGGMIIPVKHEPTMQRSFMNHRGEKRTHVISVGEPGAVNYAFDLASGSFLQFWRGDFVETTLMWYERGEPQLAVPLGSIVERSGKPSVAFLNDQNMAWPDSNANYNYIGYDIDKTGRPVFKYALGNVNVTENFQTADDGKKLLHTITVNSGSAVNNFWCRIAEGRTIAKLPNDFYAIDDKKFLIQLPDKAKPVIRKTSDNTEEMLLPVTPNGNSGTINYSIIW